VERTRESTAIVLDSTSDFLDAHERHPNMRIVPLYVLFDGVPLRDHVDIAPAEFYERLTSSSTLPTTSQPTPEDFLACYRELRDAGYERIWSLHLSAKLSGTYESARRAAEELGGGIVRVVDTGTASLACGLLAEAIDRRLAEGTTDEEVEELVARFEGANRVVFTTATLEYLQKGGRIGNAKALLATALAIKPIIEVTGGVVEQGGKQRTRSKALNFLVEKVKSYDGAIENLAVMHADCSDVDAFVDMLRPFAPGEIVVGEIGPVIGTHGGRGTIGVAFQVTT